MFEKEKTSLKCLSDPSRCKKTKRTGKTPGKNCT
jgi:hypothetical protein